MLRRRDGARPEQDYREVIRDRAAAGWRFVQAIPFESSADPRLDLVFERKVARCGIRSACCRRSHCSRPACSASSCSWATSWTTTPTISS
ncbi:DUF4177 domain-containing protein [Leucobacter sp. gxy201]